MTLKALRRTKIGRFAPSRSCPSEIFKVLTAPSWISPPSEHVEKPAGLGARPAFLVDADPRGPDPYKKEQLAHLEQY
eukprot:8127866-Pyramimonas_sp.AAC.1